MKKKKLTILLHLLGALFLIFVVYLTWSQRENFQLVIVTFTALIIFMSVISFRFHTKSQETRRLVAQYHIDAKSQQRMLNLQKAMLELSNHMTKVNGLNELLDVILQKAIEVMPEAKFGSILVMNTEGLLEFKAIYGFEQDLFQVKLDPKECYQWRATGGHFTGPLIIQDLAELSKDLMTEDNYSAMNEIGALRTKSSLSAPLLIDDQFFGSINLDSINTNVFSEEHKGLMAYFANQATIAIRNHQYYEKMLFLSKYDGLTGILNRHYFQELIEIMLQRSAREKEPVTFVLMDLDHFKAINDQYGHASGDHILAFFAKSFTAQLRQSDLFARYGGDEFIAVFFNNDRNRTTHKLESIHEKITNESIELTQFGEEVHCFFSYGIAEFPVESTELKTLIHLADQRMYEHKSAL